MSKYEKARIKLLDKNTGQVLKAIDALTCAEAVEYDDNSNVKQKILKMESDIGKYNESNDNKIKELIDKDKNLDKDISNINDTNKKQDDNLKTINSSLTSINEEIKKINQTDKDQNDSLDEIENNTYTKEQANEKFYDKEYISNNLYTKTQTNEKFYDKEYVTNNLYTKTQVNEIKQNIDKNIEDTNNNTINTVTTQIIKTGNNFARTTGTNSSYTVNFDKITAYEDGLTIVIVPNVDCTDHPKIKINNLPYLEIKDSSGEFLSSGDMLAGIPLILVKTGNYFFIRASKKAATTDEVTDADVSNPSFVTSIPLGGKIVRILNSYQVYVVSYGSLYLVDAKKKKATKISNGNFISKTHIEKDGYLDETMKKWNNYYIYGSRIFDSKFNLVKDYYSREQYFTKEYEYKEGKEHGHSEYGKSTAKIYTGKYLIVDNYMNKLYYVKPSPKMGTFKVLSDYSRNASWDDWNMEYDLNIYEIDENFNETLKCTITSKDNFPVYKNSNVLAIRNGKVITARYNNIADFSFKYATSGGFLGYNDFNLTIYNLDSGHAITDVCNSRLLRGSSPNGSSDSEDKIFVRPCSSPFGDFLISVRYNFDFGHYTSHNRQGARAWGSVLYDIEKDHCVFSYSFQSSDSGRNIEFKDPDQSFYDTVEYRGFTNNPKKILSSNCLIGYNVNSNEFKITKTNNYFNCITSKFAFITDGSNIGIYKL